MESHSGSNSENHHPKFQNEAIDTVKSVYLIWHRFIFIQNIDSNRYNLESVPEAIGTFASLDLVNACE